MKFIFPQNYSFSTKLFGLIDYQTAIFNFVCWVVLFFVTSLLKLSLFTKIIVFIFYDETSKDLAYTIKNML